jgi:hypothetical protein
MTPRNDYRNHLRNVHIPHSTYMVYHSPVMWIGVILRNSDSVLLDSYSFLCFD